MGHPVAFLVCATLVNPDVETGGWLLVSMPELGEAQSPDAVLAAVDDKPAAVLGLRGSTGPPLIAVPVPGGEPGSHTLTLIRGDQSWELAFEQHVWWLDHWLGAPTYLDGWASSERPVVYHSPEPNGDPRWGNLALEFYPGTPGMVVWEPGGALREIVPTARIYLTTNPDRPLGTPWIRHFVQTFEWTPEPLPVVVRAIRRDGTFGPAWYVGNDRRLAPEPEVEDGRYQLVNPDGSARWRSDARP